MAAEAMGLLDLTSNNSCAFRTSNMMAPLPNSCAFRLCIFLLRRLEEIQAFQNSITNACAFRHRRHWQRFVADRQVIEDGFLFTYMRRMPS